MSRPRHSVLATVVLAMLPVAAAAAVAPTTPTFLFTWGNSGTAPSQFNTPSHVAIDAQGNVYVSDQLNHRIQTFDRLGNFLAQWGTSGIAPGQFNQPVGVATDGSGNVYVVDNGNRRVQKFTSTGVFVSQWGSFGSGDGQFSGPLGAATDAAGNVYVADQFNHRIQKFTSTGVFVTKWGTSGSGNGQFSTPSGVAADAAGNVYVADNGNHRIQKFTSAGAYLGQWGGLGAGDGQFNSPNSVALDAVGNVYVADRANHRIQKFNGDGVFLTKWGSLGTGDAQFNGPLGVAVDAVGDVCVSDWNNHRVQKFSGAGQSMSDVAPTFELSWSTGTSGETSGPRGMATDAAGNVFVAAGLDLIFKYSGTGASLGSTVAPGETVDLATDPSGNVFASLGFVVRKYTNGFGTITTWGGVGSGAGQFSSAQGLGTDAAGNVYVADTGNNRIQKFTNSGAHVTSWGTAGSGNGQFTSVRDVAIDPAGNVYAVDGSRVQKFTSSGAYLTQWGSPGTLDGQFDDPQAIHADAAGNVYVADTDNHRIQKFTSHGDFLAKWDSGAGVPMNTPRGVATDGVGNVYVSDFLNHRLLRFFTPPSVAFVSDIGNDQGKQVRLRILRSSADAAGSTIAITGYAVYRLVEDLPGSGAATSLEAPGFEAPDEIALAGWDYLGTQPAAGDAEYSMVVPTLANSNATGLYYSNFMVRALTANPLVHYASAPAHGHSVDNLSPPAPSQFLAVYTGGATNLHWAMSPATDFAQFKLYRGASADFVPGPGTLVAAGPDTGYIDAGPAGSWYKLSALDFEGNESPYAVLGPAQTVDVPAPTIAFALEGLRPSPAVGGRLVVHFALASDAPATLELIDVRGRRMRSQSVGSLGPGRHAIDLGVSERVAPGLWFIRLSQGAKEAVVRALVLE